MRKNMECNKNHKSISIPDNIRTKLKMLASITTLASMAVATFSGCDAEKKEIQEISIVPETSYIQETEKEIPTTAIYENTEQESIAEETKIETSKTQIETKETEEKQDETYLNQEETTTETITVVILTEYDKLANKLQTIINNKGIDNKEIKMLLEETLERLYNNYSGWQKGYDDMPNVIDYINENFLNVLENEVSKIEFVDENSEKGQNLFNNGMAAGTTKEENGKCIIRMIIPKKEDSNYDERNYAIEEFFHEIIHCKERKITFNSNYFNNYEHLIDIFTEGSATFHQKFTNEYTNEVYGKWSIENTEGTRTIDYNKENGIGYLYELNAYEKLVYLLGYSFMNKVEKGIVDFSQIKTEMISKYAEQGNNLLNKIEEWYTYISEEGTTSDITFDSAIDLENTFLELAKKDNKNKFNHYIEKNLPTVWERKWDITNNILDTEIDNDYER